MTESTDSEPAVSLLFGFVVIRIPREDVESWPLSVTSFNTSADWTLWEP